MGASCAGCQVVGGPGTGMVSAASQWAGKPQSCSHSDLNGLSNENPAPDTLTQLCVTCYAFHGLFGSCQVIGSFQVKLHLCARSASGFIFTYKWSSKTYRKDHTFFIELHYHLRFVKISTDQMCHGCSMSNFWLVSTDLYVCPGDSHTGSCFPQILVKS